MCRRSRAARVVTRRSRIHVITVRDSLRSHVVAIAGLGVERYNKRFGREGSSLQRLRPEGLRVASLTLPF